jgi:hypothetical protein
VSRRVRAVLFALLALGCAALAASLAGSYTAEVEAQLGDLRPVVVARDDLSGRRPMRPADVRKLLEVRRVPARFAPPDAIGQPLEAIGRSVRGSVPAGSYVTASVLRLPATARAAPEPARPGREVVEIAVAGAGALATGGDPIGRRYDVVATGEPRTGGGDGRTRVVASDVELLDLQEGGASADELVPGPAAAWSASLATGREEAIRLIQAHNFAREIRLIGAG